MSAEDAGTAATLLKALADPVRVRIVNLLAQRGKLCVCDLQAAVDRSQPTVSFHLAKLVRAGLVRRERRGPWAYYALDRERLSGLADLFGGAR
ncbi:MAG TPA: metalloregulator ArsR/SmtB family transcription factor [Actinomycetota bacterium]|nr:metalloregulator ArsR/SmtB family transcription factor [Actinomycetota bacterium]